MQCVLTKIEIGRSDLKNFCEGKNVNPISISEIKKTKVPFVEVMLEILEPIIKKEVA